MPNKKEPLSIIIIKTLLVVLLFAGIGTIIVGGGWLVEKNYKNEASNKSDKIANQVNQVNQEKRNCIEEGEKFYLKPGEPQEKECCDNLKTKAVYSMIENKCVPETVASVCVDCPNDICGPGEDECNCPEDCGTEDETADWKTYRNEKYGFEVKYPEGWKTNELNENFVSFITSGREPEIEFPGDITINISENPSKLSVKEFYDGENGGADLFTGTKNISVVSINGITGMKFVGTQGLASSTVTVIPRDNFFVEIKDVAEHYQSNGIYDKILSTFKFIEKDETADWKTYRNEKYGFEVKYPQSFYIEQGDYNIGNQYRKLWIQFADSKWKDQMVHNPSLIIDLIETNLSAKEYLNKTGSSGSMLDETCSIGSTYCSVKDIKDISIGIDKIPALQFYSAAVSGSDYHAIVRNNNFLIDIRSHGSGIGDFPEDTYNQILSSFKFIEKDKRNNYILDCALKPEEFKTKYNWYEKFSNYVDNEWELDSVCYNEKLEKVVYFIHYTKSQTLSDQSVQLKIYDVENDVDNKEIEMNYSQCRKINEWSENGDIAYECNFSGPAGVSIDTNLYNTETKNNRTIESCGIGLFNPNHTKKCEDKKYKEYFDRNF